MFITCVKTCFNFKSSYTLHVLTRNLNSCPTNLNKYVAREGRMIQKMMNGSLKRKRKWFNEDGSSRLSLSPTHHTFHQGSKNSKRVSVLNKLFMKHITDLMATGEMANEVVGQGISISRVKVTPDFNLVKVYWLARGSTQDIEIEKTLTGTAGALRHELSRLRVMGVVPRIEFFKDKQYAVLAEVDQLLAKADFGEDFVPEDPSRRLKTEFTLSSALPSSIQAHIHQLDSDTKEDDSEYEEPLPPMRNDVFGLNHSLIMVKIMKSVKKSQAVHRDESCSLQRDPPPNTEDEVNTNNYPGHDDMHRQKTSIGKFIQMRQIKKRKELYGPKNYQPETEMLETDAFFNGNDFVNGSLHGIEEEEDDLIEEDDFIEDISRRLDRQD